MTQQRLAFSVQPLVSPWSHWVAYTFHNTVTVVSHILTKRPRFDGRSHPERATDVFAVERLSVNRVEMFRSFRKLFPVQACKIVAKILCRWGYWGCGCHDERRAPRENDLLLPSAISLSVLLATIWQRSMYDGFCWSDEMARSERACAEGSQDDVSIAFALHLSSRVFFAVRSLFRIGDAVAAATVWCAEWK